MMQLNAQALMGMPFEQMVACIKSWHRNKMEETHSWRFWRRDDQFEPQGDWRTWLVMAGRGFGTGPMVEIAFTPAAFGVAAQLSQTPLVGQWSIPKRGRHSVRCYNISG